MALTTPLILQSLNGSETNYVLHKKTSLPRVTCYVCATSLIHFSLGFLQSSRKSRLHKHSGQKQKHNFIGILALLKPFRFLLTFTKVQIRCQVWYWEIESRYWTRANIIEIFEILQYIEQGPTLKYLHGYNNPLFRVSLTNLWRSSLMII